MLRISFLNLIISISLINSISINENEKLYRKLHDITKKTELQPNNIVEPHSKIKFIFSKTPEIQFQPTHIIKPHSELQHLFSFSSSSTTASTTPPVLFLTTKTSSSLSATSPSPFVTNHYSKPPPTTFWSWLLEHIWTFVLVVLGGGGGLTYTIKIVVFKKKNRNRKRLDDEIELQNSENLVANQPLEQPNKTSVREPNVTNNNMQDCENLPLGQPNQTLVQENLKSELTLQQQAKQPTAPTAPATFENQCSICFRICGNPGGLAMHLKSHTDKKKQQNDDQNQIAHQNA